MLQTHQGAALPSEPTVRALLHPNGEKQAFYLFMTCRSFTGPPAYSPANLIQFCCVFSEWGRPRTVPSLLAPLASIPHPRWDTEPPPQAQMTRATLRSKATAPWRGNPPNQKLQTERFPNPPAENWLQVTTQRHIHVDHDAVAFPIFNQLCPQSLQGHPRAEVLVGPWTLRRHPGFWQRGDDWPDCRRSRRRNSGRRRRGMCLEILD